jgi:hypothetical protein
MVGVKRIPVMAVVVIAMACLACSGIPTASAPASSVPGTGDASIPPATAETSPAPTPGVAFRALDLPADFSRGGAQAVDGTTAAGWVQAGLNDEQPAVWDTTTGALRVLAVPARFVHPSGEIFTRLVGVSGTTAVGTGVLGNEARGQSRAMAWNTETGDLRILDIPAGFSQAEAHAISGTTAVGQVWTEHGETGRPVAWDTATGAVRILTVPAGDEWVNPLAISGTTIVGIRSFEDLAVPLVWNPLTADARDLDLLPDTLDGVPRAVDGTTAVGSCCFGEEGTPLPLLWDTGTGSVRRLDLPSAFAYGRALGISGSVVIGVAEFTPLLWDLETGEVGILPAPAGYDESYQATAVSGRTLVGSACQPPPSMSDGPRCVAAAWSLP